MSTPFDSAVKWFHQNTPSPQPNPLCETRDVFQAKLDVFLRKLIKLTVPNPEAYLLSAVAGEIGNNSFDHNLGQWQDAPGCWFEYLIDPNNVHVILADRGQGVLASLKRVQPDLKDGEAALKTAFYERLSGRKPEKRGNGLKFVRNVMEPAKNKGLFYCSGDAIISFGSLASLTPPHIQNVRGKGVICYFLWKNL